MRQYRRVLETSLPKFYMITKKVSLCAWLAPAGD